MADFQLHLAGYSFQALAVGHHVLKYTLHDSNSLWNLNQAIDLS